MSSPTLCFMFQVRHCLCVCIFVAFSAAKRKRGRFRYQLLQEDLPPLTFFFKFLIRRNDSLEQMYKKSEIMSFSR